MIDHWSLRLLNRKDQSFAIIAENILKYKSHAVDLISSQIWKILNTSVIQKLGGMGTSQWSRKLAKNSISL